MAHYLQIYKRIMNANRERTVKSINQTAIVIKSKKAFSDVVVCLKAYTRSDRKSESYAKVILLAESEINADPVDYIRKSYQTICDSALKECTGGNYKNGSLKICYDTFRMWFDVTACETVRVEKIAKTSENGKLRSSITNMLNCAKIYESMGLFAEALEAYEKIMAMEIKLKLRKKKPINDHINRLKKEMTVAAQNQNLLLPAFSPEPFNSTEGNAKGIKKPSFKNRFISEVKHSKPCFNGICGLIADQQTIENFIKEADLYRSHDLRREAQDKYNEALVLLCFNHSIKGRKQLWAYVNKMLTQIENNFGQPEKEPIYYH